MANPCLAMITRSSTGNKGRLANHGKLPYRGSMLETQVRSTHTRFDEFTQEWVDRWHGIHGKVHCRKGCSGCCSLAVHTTFPEAFAVAAKLTTKQQQSLSDYIERLMSALPGLANLKNYLRQHRTVIGPCPFVDHDGACGIYTVRPLTCRALLSTRPAEWCTVDFTTLGSWDRQAYETGLDRRVVDWPTHYVAATREAGRLREAELLTKMKQAFGWSLAGNFPLMVWLAHPGRLGQPGLSGRQADEQLDRLGIMLPFLLQLETASVTVPTTHPEQGS